MDSEIFQAMLQPIAFPTQPNNFDLGIPSYANAPKLEPGGLIIDLDNQSLKPQEGQGNSGNTQPSEQQVISSKNETNSEEKPKTGVACLKEYLAKLSPGQLPQPNEIAKLTKQSGLSHKSIMYWFLGEQLKYMNQDIKLIGLNDLPASFRGKPSIKGYRVKYTPISALNRSLYNRESQLGPNGLPLKKRIGAPLNVFKKPKERCPPHGRAILNDYLKRQPPDHFPSRNVRVLLAQKCNWSFRQVTTWFVGKLSSHKKCTTSSLRLEETDSMANYQYEEKNKEVARAFLAEFAAKHPPEYYPTKADKQELAIRSGLDTKEVGDWFSGRRTAYRKEIEPLKEKIENDSLQSAIEDCRQKQENEGIFFQNVNALELQPSNSISASNEKPADSAPSTPLPSVSSLLSNEANDGANSRNLTAQTTSQSGSLSAYSTQSASAFHNLTAPQGFSQGVNNIIHQTNYYSQPYSFQQQATPMINNGFNSQGFFSGGYCSNIQNGGFNFQMPPVFQGNYANFPAFGSTHQTQNQFPYSTGQF